MDEDALEIGNALYDQYAVDFSNYKQGSFNGVKPIENTEFDYFLLYNICKCNSKNWLRTLHLEVKMNIKVDKLRLKLR